MHDKNSLNDRLKGSMVALVTPFDAQGDVDRTALTNLLDWHIAEGTDGVVVSGTTGEAATLSHQEHTEVIKFTVDHVAKRIPVLGGTGSNNTAEALALTKAAEAVGVDVALLITPYYNKPTQNGLLAHFQCIHDNTNVPLMLYDVPGRTVTALADDTIVSLSKLPRVVGVKDATAALSRVGRLASKVPADFVQLSGDDATTLPYLRAGGHGCISVSANIMPKLCSVLYDLHVKGENEQADRIDAQLQPLHDIMFCETSPGPVKYALSKMGKCPNTFRLPLVEVTDESKVHIDEVLHKFSL